MVLGLVSERVRGTPLACLALEYAASQFEWVHALRIKSADCRYASGELLQLAHRIRHLSRIILASAAEERGCVSQTGCQFSLQAASHAVTPKLNWCDEPQQLIWKSTARQACPGKTAGKHEAEA